MPEELTHLLFEKQIDTEFRIDLNDSSDGHPSQPDESGSNIILTLTEVKPLGNHGGQQRQPFSLLFKAPTSTMLQQGTYHLTHSDIDIGPLFIVPVNQTEYGYLYEAVFN